jgi:hypothetical protein
LTQKTTMKPKTIPWKTREATLLQALRLISNTDNPEGYFARKTLFIYEGWKQIFVEECLDIAETHDMRTLDTEIVSVIHEQGWIYVATGKNRAKLTLSRGDKIYVRPKPTRD